MLDRLSKSSPTVQPLFDCCSCVMTYSSTQTSPRSSLLALHLSSSRLLTSARSSTLQVAPMLKSLGVTIDSHLRFDCHAKEVARACNCHTRALRHVRTVLTDYLAQTVACSIVGSRLDYCNAMLYCASAATFDVLQRAQNNLARVVSPRGGRSDARPLLRSLHWLPVIRRPAAERPKNAN